MRSSKRPRRLVVVLLFLAAGAMGVLVPAEETPARVDFVTPRPSETVVGPGTIELLIEPGAGPGVAKVELWVDGARIATLAAPPWRAGWDAGDALEPHRLEAVVQLSDGAVVRRSVRTSPLRIDQYEQVALVNVYAVVRDRKGGYVSGLTRDEFRVTESGRPQRVDRFSDEWKPLRIAIVLDCSLSMGEKNKFQEARDAALSFLETLRDDDQGLVITFSDRADVVQPLTGDRAALAAAIHKARPTGGTALYDAVWRAAEVLDAYDGRRVIVLLSDGRDEAASGLEPGSLHTQEEALDRSLRAEAMIFAIGFGRDLASEWDFFRRRTVASILRDLADSSGGRALFSSREGKLRTAFGEVAEDLRHQYSLAYTSDDPKQDGAWREIGVATTRPELRVVARKGYFATKDRAARRAPPRKR